MLLPVELDTITTEGMPAVFLMISTHETMKKENTPIHRMESTNDA